MKYAMCLKKKMTGKRNNKATKENHIRLQLWKTKPLTCYGL